jgi:hypothetical protein
MRRFTALTIACISFLLLSNIALSKEKERNWQTGKVVDMNRDKSYAGTVDLAGNGSSTAVYRVYETYAIEAEDYVYVCEEHLKWRWSKPAVLTVNAPVRFAIEKDRIYIKSEDASEHETKIIKKILKTQPPPAKP